MAFWASPLSGQEVAIEERIAEAEQVLRMLDAQAGGCLAQLADTSDAGQSAMCADFLAAIDGENLAGYLAHCDALKQWRDDYVENPPAAATEGERDLQRLIGIERTCGENALRRRTRFVAEAFDAISTRRASRLNGLSLQRRLGGIDFQSSLRGWRNELNATTPNHRIHNETLRQFDQLEEELIRQQINRPQPF